MKLWRQLWSQRPRDFFFRATGITILLAEGAGWIITGHEPNSAICVSAIGLFGLPQFLKKDER